jgi:hypothetical protein
MKTLGPNWVERSFTLVGSAGEHQALVIGNVLLRLLPVTNDAGMNHRGEEAKDQRLVFGTTVCSLETHTTPAKVHIEPGRASTTKLRQKPTTVDEGHRRQ